jgi:hypothetical protein
MLGELKKTEFMIGKNSGKPSGTEHVRSADPPLTTPARNHIGPRCQTMQLLPVVSSKGFTEFAIETAHCHHSPVRSGNWPGGKPCADTTSTGAENPMTTAAIANRFFMRFMASSLAKGQVFIGH